MLSPKAVYIHIPFCATKCHYCDFTAYVVDGQPVDDYIDALEKEIEMTVKDAPPGKLDSIFIGGGTPTVLTPVQMEKLLRMIQSYFPNWSSTIEYTMEANPGTTSSELLSVMRAGGVNRLSFGAQTFEPHLLRDIGRSHGVSEIATSVKDARYAGFTNISLDLMFGLPNQTVEQVRDTLERAVALSVDHFSCYSLKVEEGTLFYHLEERGQLPLPTEDAEYAMYQLIRDYLLQQGYVQYEVSNFSKPGRSSKHNSTYWRNEAYYGFGAGAHGYVNHIRHANVKGITEYIGRIDNGERPILQQNKIDIQEQMENYFILGLRLLAGVSLKQFEQQYGLPADKVFKEAIETLVKKQFLIIEDDTLRLTEQGLLFGNDVFAQFLY
ncbi:radical SAM family heme chaperone HemW [Shimazuella sp. AN120528]|uniref:radical SAM family heme chaperone HemW n=1 Tax=Shimazuella soli TaxID=1892854 RepID=UPI001F0D5086|nr:radical SAM family heme chaperone HemW [Shimazuella soli]